MSFQGVPLHAREPVRLTLAEAEKLAVKNNPQLSAAVLDAAASFQIPVEYRAAYLPTLQGNVTGAVSQPGSRLAAGGLNNPSVYNRFAAGLTLSQMVTDFGRTGNLVDMARLRADAQNQVAEQTRADILLVTGQTYFAVLRAHAVVEVAEQTVKARQLVADQISALAQSKLKIGVGCKLCQRQSRERQTLAGPGGKHAEVGTGAACGSAGSTG